MPWRDVQLHRQLHANAAPLSAVQLASSDASTFLFHAIFHVAPPLALSFSWSPLLSPFPFSFHFLFPEFSTSRLTPTFIFSPFSHTFLCQHPFYHLFCLTGSRLPTHLVSSPPVMFTLSIFLFLISPLHPTSLLLLSLCPFVNSSNTQKGPSLSSMAPPAGQLSHWQMGSPWKRSSFILLRTQNVRWSGGGEQPRDEAGKETEVINRIKEDEKK